MDACRKACDLSNYYLNALLQLVNDPTASFCPQTHLFASSNPLLPSLLTPRQLQVLIHLTDISTVYSYCERLVETLAQCIRGAREQMHVLAEQGVLHEERHGYIMKSTRSIADNILADIMSLKS